MFALQPTTSFLVLEQPNQSFSAENKISSCTCFNRRLKTSPRLFLCHFFTVQSLLEFLNLFSLLIFSVMVYFRWSIRNERVAFERLCTAAAEIDLLLYDSLIPQLCKFAGSFKPLFLFDSMNQRKLFLLKVRNYFLFNN